MAKQTVNILLLGEKWLKSLTLTTFNKKVWWLNDGYVDEDAELDIDDMPATSLSYEAGTEAWRVIVCVQLWIIWFEVPALVRNKVKLSCHTKKYNT